MSDMLTFIKRRFSSTDLTSDSPEGQNQSRPNAQFNSSTNTGNTMIRNQSVTQPYQRYNTNMHRTTELNQSAAISARETHNTGGMTSSDVATNQSGIGSKKVYPSAPSSPSRSAGSFGSQMVGNASSNYFAGSMSQLTKGIFSAASTAANTVRDKTAIVTGAKTKILLVIDEPYVDWTKVFRGRRIMDDYDIKVEQAQFSEITITSQIDQGCVCTITSQSTKQTRSFKPEFVLVRQSATDLNHEWSNIVIGLAIGQVYSLNNLSTVLHMKNEAWVLAHLLQIRNFLGKENFPLLSKSYHSSNKELNNIPPLPCVVKIGDGHYGDAKMKIDNAITFQDLASVTSITEKSIIVENFVESKCDFIVQKIGTNYRAFLRKSISGNWKVNVGSSMLEKVPMNEKFRSWVDEVSKLFGGLDICSVHGVISKTGEYQIIGANGSETVLLGETQEDDRRIISELVVNKWNSLMSNNRPMAKPLPKSPSMTGGDIITSNMSQSVISSSNPLPMPPPPSVTPSSVVQKPSSTYTSTNTPIMPTSSLFNKGASIKSTSIDSNNDVMTKPSITSHDQQPLRSTTYTSSVSSHGIGPAMTPSTTPMNPPAPTTSSLFSSQRNTSLEMNSTSAYQPKSSLFTSGSSTSGDQLPPPPPPPVPQVSHKPTQPLTHANRSQSGLGNTGSEGNVDESDDTMKNLRKTFAGIFGDM